MAEIWDNKLGIAIQVTYPLGGGEGRGEAVCPNKGCTHSVNVRGKKSQGRIVKDIQAKIEKHLKKCAKPSY